jgi:hypothetical protein
MKTTKTTKATKTKAKRITWLYGLRTCSADMTSHEGAFKWPKKGRVECDDWNPAPNCGHGLHFLPLGVGNGALLNWAPDAKWLVMRCDASLAVAITEDGGGKSKCPWCEVMYCGDSAGAQAWLNANVPEAKTVATVGAVRGAGHYGTAHAGDSGTAHAGNNGTAHAGDSGTAHAGDSGTARAGYYGTARAGDSGTAHAGYSGTAHAGNNGTAHAGNRGTAHAGNNGTAHAGGHGTAHAGDHGTAHAGNYGTAQTIGEHGLCIGFTVRSGQLGLLAVRWWDGTRHRLTVGYVGEAGVKADTWYSVKDGKLVEVPEPAHWAEAERRMKAAEALGKEVAK